MVETVLGILSGFVINTIQALGYFGIFFCMVIESANIPLPSEIIMPFSGYLANQGTFTLWGVALSGALGNMAGSMLSYGLGAYGGRPFLEKYGKYLLISAKDLAWADRWFEKYGDKATFIARMLPMVRTFISLPAGIARMNFLKFSLYSFLGSLPWCFGLAYIGFKFGENWNALRPYFHQFDLVIGLILLAGLGYFIYSHLKNRKEIGK